MGGEGEEVILGRTHIDRDSQINAEKDEAGRRVLQYYHIAKHKIIFPNGKESRMGPDEKSRKKKID